MAIRFGMWFAAIGMMAISVAAQAQDEMPCAPLLDIREVSARLARSRIPMVRKDDQFDIYATADGRVVIQVSRPGYFAHPSIICRNLISEPQGVRVHWRFVCAAAATEQCDRVPGYISATNRALFPDSGDQAFPPATGRPRELLTAPAR
jgi:hypothetical protein